jgi:hypothetical protein
MLKWYYKRKKGRKMHKKKLYLLILLIVAFGMTIFPLACSSPSTETATTTQATETTKAEESKEAVQTEETIATTTETTPETEPIELPSYEFEGKGKSATDIFELESGLVTFKITHKGSSNFSITLMDDAGEYVDLLVNVIGSHEGAKALGIKSSGKYICDIQADGNWTLKIEQPRPSTGDKPPLELSGKGQSISQFLELSSGLMKIEMKHKGESNFSVLLLDGNGDYIDLLANEIGNFEGTKAIGIDSSGIYIMSIEADGEWAINIEQ